MSETTETPALEPDPMPAPEHVPEPAPEPEPTPEPAPPTIFEALRDRVQTEHTDDTVRVEPAELTALRKAAADASLALKVGQIDRYEALCRALAKALSETVAAQGFAPMSDEKALAIITQRFPITELDAS